MSGLELNKIAASILLAGLLAMIAGTVSKAIYKTDTHGEEKRGYEVQVEDAPAEGGAGKEEAIDIADLMAAANADNGEKISKKCMACHSFEKDGANKVGPNLWGVLGGKISHREDFDYSKSFRELGGEWNYEKIFEFLNNPKKFVKGTKMAFIGLAKPEDIADMIAFLRANSDSPPPLPEKAVEEKQPENSAEILPEVPEAKIVGESETEEDTALENLAPAAPSTPAVPENAVSEEQAQPANAEDAVTEPAEVEGTTEEILPEELDTEESESEKAPDSPVIFELEGSPDINPPSP